MKEAPLALVASFVKLWGTVTTGGTVSVTMILKFFVAMLLCESEALHETGVVPYGKVPDPGEQLTVTTPSIPSIAVAV